MVERIKKKPFTEKILLFIFTWFLWKEKSRTACINLATKMQTDPIL